MTDTQLAPAMELQEGEGTTDIRSPHRSPHPQLSLKSFSSPRSASPPAVGTNSPTLSEASTQFFDAHEEIVLTPERPRAEQHLSSLAKQEIYASADSVPAGSATTTAHVRLAESENVAGGSKEWSLQTKAAAHETAEYFENDRGLLRTQESLSTAAPAVQVPSPSPANSAGPPAPAYLFPSKEFMLKIEDRRSSIDAPSPSEDNTASTDATIQPGNAASATAPAEQPARTTEGQQERRKGVGTSVSGDGVRTRDDRGARGDEVSIEGDRKSNSSSVGDDEGGGDETSTASGTITEGGEWESRHGFDVEYAVEERGQQREVESSSPGGDGSGAAGGEHRKSVRREGVGSGSSRSPETTSKRASLKRMFKSARTGHVKMISIRRKRGGTAGNASASGSPTLDSSNLTSPDGPQTKETSNVPGLSATAATPPRKDAEGTKKCAKRGFGGGGRVEGAPEVKVQQHGRGGSKKDGWRWMHMVQRLRFHEGPVWTVEFNRHGTRMATAGQDGRVVVWNVSVPSSSGSDDEEADGLLDPVVDSAHDKKKKNGAEDRQERPSNSRGREEEELNMGGAVSGSQQVGTGVDVLRREATDRTTPGSAASSSDDFGSGSIGRSGGGAKSQSATTSGTEGVFSGLKAFESEPARVYSGHKSDVVDLSWSHSDFLCSASIDHTVMLWHPFREERLGTFTHPNFVTAVRFHPWNDHVFLTGCFDKRLRLWTIPDGRVANWVQCQDMITAANFSPDGQLTAAGLNDGRVMFYHTAGLRYYTQIHCKNRRGGNRRGKKVTGLAFVETAQLRHREQQPCDPSLVPTTPAAGGGGGGLGAAPSRGSQVGGKADSMSAQYSLLSTTNDSRLRVYDLDNFAMTSKFKGLLNDGMQIKGSFSEDGKFVISGSEDGQVYIWNSKHGPGRRPSGHSLTKCGSAVGAGPSEAAAAAAAASAAAATPQGRVKSRSSSSFSVQCSVRPKVATVASFVPASALHLVLERWDGLDCDVSERGVGRTDGGVFPGSGSAAATATAAAGGDCVPKEGIVKGSRGWRGSRLRRSSAPVAADTFGKAAAAIVGDEGDPTLRLRRRRWSFTVQARLAGLGGGGGSSTKSWQSQPRSSSHKSLACRFSGGKYGSQGRFSLSPVPGRGQKCKCNTTPDGRSPGASTQSPRASHWAASSQLPTDTTPGSDEGTERTTGSTGTSGNGSSWGCVESSGGSVGGIRAVVTADYNGELKVFLGFGEAPL